MGLCGRVSPPVNRASHPLPEGNYLEPKPKPVFVFVPGAWHTPEVYAATREILEKQGFRTVGCALPSVGADPPVEDFKEDVAAIRGIMAGLTARTCQNISKN